MSNYSYRRNERAFSAWLEFGWSWKPCVYLPIYISSFVEFIVELCVIYSMGNETNIFNHAFHILFWFHLTHHVGGYKLVKFFIRVTCVFLVLKMDIIWLTGFNSRCGGWGTQEIISYWIHWHRQRYGECCKNWRGWLLESWHLYPHDPTGKFLISFLYPYFL